MHNPFSLLNKMVFVTGASSGIGKATAIECSKMGAKVIISGRNEERLDETFNQLEGEGHLKIGADLSMEKDLDKVIDFAPVLTGLVNCAGLGEYIPFPFINRDKIDKTFDINFYAPAILTQKLLKKKKIINGGSIVFISSISGVYCSAYGASLYSASKGAINGLIKGMALDLSVKQIRVNSVNPGVINTNIFENGVITEEQLKEDMQKYPLKRHGNPEEVAYAVIYLLSDASQWVTGNNLVIDGGYTLL